MLATMLNQHPELRAFRGEGEFFERLPDIEALEETHQQRQAVADEIGKAEDPPLDEDTRNEVRTRLPQTQTKSRQTSLVEQYVFGKSYLAQKSRAERWVQKATSYVFHVPTIAQHLPHAQYLFILRNPMDLAASKKRRGAKEKWLRTLWGWRAGVQRARELEAKMPERFCVVKYENLVREPEDSLRNVCTFCGVSYQASVLDIPHVNRAETPYNRSSTDTGLNTDRVFYFIDELTAAEAATVQWLVGGDLLRGVYPDLPEAVSTVGTESALEAAAIMWRGVSHLIADQGKLLFAEPKRALKRVQKRIFD